MKTKHGSRVQSGNAERRTQNAERMVCRYITVNDWLANRRDLSSTEKLIVAHIMGFGPAGCWKSSSEFARYLGITRRHFIRAYVELVRKQWIAPGYERRTERVLFINEEMLENLPLLKGQKGCGKPVKSHPPASDVNAHTGDKSGSAGSDNLSPALYRTEESFLSEIENKEIKHLVGACAEMTKNRAGGELTNAEFERRRQKLQKDLARRCKENKP